MLRSNNLSKELTPAAANWSSHLWVPFEAASHFIFHLIKIARHVHRPKNMRTCCINTSFAQLLFLLNHTACTGPLQMKCPLVSSLLEYCHCTIPWCSVCRQAGRWHNGLHVNNELHRKPKQRPPLRCASRVFFRTQPSFWSQCKKTQGQHQHCRAVSCPPQHLGKPLDCKRQHQKH